MIQAVHTIHTIEETAHALGMTAEQVTETERKALRKLRHNKDMQKLHAEVSQRERFDASPLYSLSSSWSSERLALGV